MCHLHVTKGRVFSAYAEVVPKRRVHIGPRVGILRVRGGSSGYAHAVSLKSFVFSAYAEVVPHWSGWRIFPAGILRVRGGSSRGR